MPRPSPRPGLATLDESDRLSHKEDNHPKATEKRGGARSRLKDVEPEDYHEPTPTYPYSQGLFPEPEWKNGLTKAEINDLVLLRATGNFGVMRRPTYQQVVPFTPDQANVAVNNGLHREHLRSIGTISRRGLASPTPGHYYTLGPKKLAERLWDFAVYTHVATSTYTGEVKKAGLIASGPRSNEDEPQSVMIARHLTYIGEATAWVLWGFGYYMEEIFIPYSERMLRRRMGVYSPVTKRIWGSPVFCTYVPDAYLVQPGFGVRIELQLSRTTELTVQHACTICPHKEPVIYVIMPDDKSLFEFLKSMQAAHPNLIIARFGNQDDLKSAVVKAMTMREEKAPPACYLREHYSRPGFAHYLLETGIAELYQQMYWSR